MSGDDIINLALMGKRTMKQRIEWAVNMEREACAKVCDEYDVAEDVCSSDTAEGIAAAIRARRLSKYLAQDPPFPLMP